MAALPAGHPLAAGQVENSRAQAGIDRSGGETFILYRRPLGPGLYDSIIAACQRAGFSPNIGQEAPRMLATLSLVAAGLGVTLVPQSMRRLQVHGVIYRPLDSGRRPCRAAQPRLSPRRKLGRGAALYRAGPADTPATLRRQLKRQFPILVVIAVIDSRKLRDNSI